MGKQLDHIVVFSFLTQSWMWCLFAHLNLLSELYSLRDGLGGECAKKRQASWEFQVLSVMDSPPSQNFEKHSIAEGIEC